MCLIDIKASAVYKIITNTFPTNAYSKRAGIAQLVYQLDYGLDGWGVRVRFSVVVSVKLGQTALPTQPPI
jgi:hypothetical protein